MYPDVPAAFINAIAEEGTKAEAVEWLQKQFNETCALRKLLRQCYELSCDAPRGTLKEEIGKAIGI